ncbi:hypothetical protein AWZ03_006610 [Drosophila navojoa]|uniref:Uncharacterized protein n=1 Tax=Drosophila navojoa TaxID=7232 RepID=A0A484BDH6_DRONA|nr:hypothetical protein AWZ03_006610 [Drosophila navojoa]
MSEGDQLIKIFPETDLTDIQRIELNAAREMLLRSTREKELEAMKNPKPQSRIEARDQLSPWGAENTEKPCKSTFITPLDDFLSLE